MHLPIAAGIALAVALSGPASAAYEGQAPAPAGTIVFASTRGTGIGGQISSVEVATGRHRILSRFPYDDHLLSVSPAGDRIAFTRTSGGVFVMSGAGTRIRRIGSGRGNYTEVTWSPNAEFVAFDALASDGEFFVSTVVSLRTGRTLRIPLALSPRLSPDGMRVAYTQQLRSSEDTFIRVRSLVGGRAWRIPGEEVSWSPDGRRIAISRNGRTVIATTDGRMRRSFGGTFAAWSPDGNRFTLIGGSPFKRQYGPLDVLSVDTGARRRLGSAIHQGPVAWSPDGTRIAFAGKIGRREGSFVVSMDGRIRA